MKRQLMHKRLDERESGEVVFIVSLVRLVMKLWSFIICCQFTSLSYSVHGYKNLIRFV
jgi:hypothetical protein